jgi:glutamyl/glutaminyl-tRNA synthetase
MDGAYRGRLALSPTGYLHAGHARTFWTAQQRAQAAGGILILRNEDLDPSRSREEFVQAMMEDLRWFGLRWQEGPDVGGPYAPYAQSQRRHFYRAGFERLRRAGRVYPCYCSRQDVLRALQAPHADQEEPVYPGTCRPPAKKMERAGLYPPSWRFLVTDGQVIEFEDGRRGPQRFVAGQDFGDFVVWRHDDVPSYQLAVVLDDAAMRISEVVRGEDLLLSTARQLLLYRALGLEAPAFYHCSLLTDQAGQRLAKREDAVSLRALRQQGLAPEMIRRSWPGNAGCAANASSGCSVT